jgi:nitrite reductase/ring-hydroxylating ferredoxin subunit
MRVLERIERASALDGVVETVRRWVRRLVPPGPAADALHGTWLGHPLHPALTDIPIGAWGAAAVLDALPGQEKAATTLVGIGLAGAVPTALAGAVDWASAGPEQGRVGLIHALTNDVALVAYAASLVARLRGRHADGRAWATAGLLVASAGAYLGGHLAHRTGPGFNYAAPAWQRLPTEWTPVDSLAALPVGKPVRRLLGDVPVLVYRGPRLVHVLVEQCAHLAGPLSEGTVTVVDDEPCVVCPWHGSTYRLEDGAVRRGPSPVPQPVLLVRVLGDRVEARRP